MELIEKIKNAVSFRALVIRAFIFGLSWYFLPFWLFAVVALVLYLVVIFGTRKFALPFLTIVFFAAIEPKSVFFAVIFAAIFYLILGVKEIIFIERKAAYEILVLVLSFFAFVDIFRRFDSWTGIVPFLLALATGMSVFFLLKGYLSYCSESVPANERAVHGNIFAAIAGLTVAQMSIAAFLLPLNYFYQASLVFLSSVVMVELASAYLEDKLDRRMILSYLSVFLVFSVIILGSAQWGL
jgi:hypothetical protein